MADKRDYYEVLGVSKTATDAEIKKALDLDQIKKRRKKHHRIRDAAFFKQDRNGYGKY